MTASRMHAPLCSCTGSTWSWVVEAGLMKWERSWRDSMKKVASWTGKSQIRTQEMVKVAQKVRTDVERDELIDNELKQRAWVKCPLLDRCCCVSVRDGAVSCTVTHSHQTGFEVIRHILYFSFHMVVHVACAVKGSLTDWTGFNYVNICTLYWKRIVLYFMMPDSFL